MNKTLLKLAGLAFAFSIADLLVIIYWFLRCQETDSAFYCDAFVFAGLLFMFGIPALILLGSALILLAFSRWYKGNISVTAKTLITILIIIFFAGPYIPQLLPSGQPRTYKGFLEQMEQNRLDQARDEQTQCETYIQLKASWKEGQPMPTPPYPGCN